MECIEVFANENFWRDHVASRHHIFFSPPRSKIPGLLVHSQCPLCLSFVGLTRRAFSTHVGKHMEKIALTALPPEMEFGTKSEAELSDDGASTDDERENITFKLDVASECCTVSAVKLDQPGGDGLGKGPDHLTYYDSQTPSEPRSRASTIKSTDMSTIPPQHKQDLSPALSTLLHVSSASPRTVSGGLLQHTKEPIPTVQRVGCQRCRSRKVSCLCHVPPLPCPKD